MLFIRDFIHRIRPSLADTFVDQIHYFWTSLVIGLMALTVGCCQFGGRPITCWTPAQFTPFWNQYVVDYCFVENTYWLRWDTSNINKAGKFAKKTDYYQWVPFVLAFQSVLFYAPHLIWRVLTSYSGLNIDRMIRQAKETKSIDVGKRSKNLTEICEQMDTGLSMVRVMMYQNDHGFMVLRRFYKLCRSSRITLIYLGIKILYVANVIGQFFLLNTFLSPKRHLWGVEILTDLVNGRDWQQSGNFPRSTLCNFKVRILGNLQRHTVQCVLWINMLNEKIFLFIWFWLFFLAILSVLDLAYWLVVSFFPGANREFVAKFVRIKRLMKSSADLQICSKFLDTFQPDGVFVLRLFAQNVGELVTSQLVETAWQRYKKSHDAKNSIPPVRKVKDNEDLNYDGNHSANCSLGSD